MTAGGGSGQNTFRGTGEDWNALSTTAGGVKQSVDSSAQMVSTAGNN